MPKDYFSTQADAYKQFRPTYPAALFDFLARDLAPDALVWDCATGNGQAALALGDCVGAVVASDQSSAQLVNAGRGDSVHYVQALAEAVPLADRSVDLVTVAQALHWFEFEAFYREATRVLKPGGLLAAWTYSFLSVSPQLGADLDTAVRDFYHNVIGTYWPPERRWVDEQYRSIPFPFAAVTAPEFAIEVEWDLPSVLGYMSSWSAVQRYKDDVLRDPLPTLAASLAPLWGEPQTVRRLRWPLNLRLGRTP